MEKKVHGIIDDLIKFALIALLIVLPIRTFIAQPFIVRGASMVPTFENGEYLIVDQLSYRFSEPARGDVIILRYPRDPKTFFIKRIIGLPGETIEILGDRIAIQDEDGTILFLDEPYIAPERRQQEFGVYRLSEGEYFVMGDNRIESSDSRSWGVLSRDEIIGRAFLRLLPIDRVSAMPGAVINTNNQ